MLMKIANKYNTGVFAVKPFFKYMIYDDYDVPLAPTRMFTIHFRW